ncbi:MAG: RNA 2'-phosphotransferase, partial [Candidatus Fonsibacter sp.]
MMNISRQQIDSLIANMNKKRLEIKDNKIRAVYGHSFEDKVKRTPAKPPDVLYHGTSPFTSYLIKKDGIRPMSRQYVHLSSNPTTAEMVGKRKDKNPTI